MGLMAVDVRAQRKTLVSVIKQYVTGILNISVDRVHVTRN